MQVGSHTFQNSPLITGTKNTERQGDQQESMIEIMPSYETTMLIKTKNQQGVSRNLSKFSGMTEFGR